jgi:hypothetical protein
MKTEAAAGFRRQHTQPAQFGQLTPLRAVKFGAGLCKRTYTRQISAALHEIADALRKHLGMAVVINAHNFSLLYP